MGIIEFLSDRRFHQVYTLPPDPGNGRLQSCRISYADFGEPDSNAVVLLCGALMAGRFAYSPLDQLAKRHKVRIVHPDRFGIGASDPVPLFQRIQSWLEMVPRLLKHLGITHISIASHSGGVIYALNTILTYPDLLSPHQPYVTFFAPWVHHSHSNITSLRAIAWLPTAVISEFACLVRFASKFLPLGGLSGNALQALCVSGPTTVSPATSILDPKFAEENPFDIDLDNPIVVQELRRLIVTYHFAEETVGQSEDAQLFLKKPKDIPWSSPAGLWSDVDEFVSLLSKTINEEKSTRTWTVDAFHAQEDSMVGETGRAWFDHCWTPTKTSLELNKSTSTSMLGKLLAGRKGYGYRSEVVARSDHNYLLDPVFGTSDVWLARVAASFKS